MEIMKFKKSLILGLLLGVLVFGAFYPNVNFKEREGLILHAVLNFLDQAHFTPKDINDEFSETVYHNYLEYIDRGKRYLTAEDIAVLAPHKNKIDDQAEARTFEFFEQSLVLIDNGIEKAEGFYEELIDEKIDFTSEEFIEFDGEKKAYAKNDTELKDHWRKIVKYEIMSRIYDLNVEQEDLEEGEEKMTESDIVTKATSEAKKMYERQFKNINKLRRSDRFENYLNSITHGYDPHSDYFSPKEKQDFDINMGGKLEGIGARLRAEGDYIQVTDIIPGGPAWKGKELEVNDLIHKVTQKGGEPMDITGMRTDDVIQKIRGKKGTVVILTVKKENGEMADIEITRDIVNIEETFAKSLILDIPDVAEKIGYIKLPKFYSSFEKKDGNSCAVDVANEIEKLKSENVNGIILDLRFNGGGSLRDVVDMTGLFIESGPIVQVKPREKAPYVYSDKDHEVRYDGPVVVMVNNFSASASEILAAALQDYNRAVIVGSNSTFGKGTVQRFFDLDDAIKGAKELKPLGQVKMTMQKFFRIDGGSTQLKGVIPDIILPDNYTYIEIGEKDYDGPLEWTKIDAVPGYDQKVYSINNMESLAAKSKARVSADPEFTLINENAKRLKEVREKSSYSLKLTDFENLMMDRLASADKFEEGLDKDVENLNVSTPALDRDKINSDEAAKEKQDDWIEGVKKDIYLEEVLHIMADMGNAKSGTISSNKFMKKG
jgi:carboxyl-terminal processing protease